MKDFFKTMLAVICGILALELIYGIFAGIALVSLIAAGFSGSSAPDAKGILDMDLSKIVITEQKNPNDFSSLASFQSDLEVKQVALRDAVIALKTAAADPSIKMVLLRPDGVSAGMADIQELYKALAAFRESGKPVIAFTESPGNAAYYLATAADKIYMSSAKGATYTLVGISGRMIFLKDVLDKLGINYQLIRHGKYKSAGEMYIRNSASEANREQNRVMIKSAWDNFAGDICDARGIAPEKFNALIDNLSLCFPEDFLKEGLVDELVDRTALVNKLCLLYGVEKEEDLSIASFADYANKLSETANTLRSVSKQPAVAVLYADGEIVDGSGYKGVAGDRFVREIEKIRKDNSVKAVVLRKRCGIGQNQGCPPEAGCGKTCRSLLRQLRSFRRILDFRRLPQDLLFAQHRDRLHRRFLPASRILPHGQKDWHQRRDRRLQQAQRHVHSHEALRQGGNRLLPVLCGRHL